MCRYSNTFKYYILLLSVSSSWANMMDDEVQVQILKLEELISQNNKQLLRLEANTDFKISGHIEATELCCETHVREKETQLAACRAQAKTAADELKEIEDHFTTLLQNLTSCRISLMAKDYQDQIPSEVDLEAKISELSLQLKLKDATILELQTLTNEHLLKLQAAHSKLKAYDDELEEFQPRSCLPFGSTTGIYRIKLPGLDSFYVPCDARFAGSGWLVIQRRMDGSVNFFRNWSDYQVGFGALNGEFFIGLEKLHRLTALQPYELYVHLEDFEGEIRYAHYDNFSIGSEKTFYELSSLGRYTGNAGNSMGLNVLQKFSTLDSDNDSWLEGSCARRYHSAWWYAACAAFCNPNGKYYKRRQLSTSSRGKGIIWQHWHGFEETLKFIQLMIRPISAANY
ncbi:fibrinogen-like protein 1 [Drosophila montana]|uniref:fibrinogen-like protein 1 n=1 Tax=Drosophila montana TaxID=40370 RepID=UPI00313B00AF